ncbi:hypothetical protein [Actinocrispum sp. NPDC049592]|uniref:hypothetical protein n=1 Tax=Actinocrispum sp. NPDC049592 TaxID=3154835 RepID=UPI00343D9DD6
MTGKVVLRSSNRELLGGTVNLYPDQSRHVVSLPPGRAVVFTDGMDRPIRVDVPLGEDRERVLAARSVTVAATRSVACGAECRNRPCVLREVNRAAQLAENPQVVLWIELLTAAHLVGRPAPRPDRWWLTELRTVSDRRTLECAVAHRVQAAIDTRYAGLTAYYQPEALAEHLVAVALCALDGKPSRCDEAEVWWQAGRHRWADVLRVLRSAAPGDPRHPDTDAWAARGLRLRAMTAAGQLAELRAHPDLWLPPRSVVTGDGDPVAVDAALDRLSPPGDHRIRLLEATRFLDLTTAWPTAVFGQTKRKAA